VGDRIEHEAFAQTDPQFAEQNLDDVGDFTRRSRCAQRPLRDGIAALAERRARRGRELFEHIEQVCRLERFGKEIEHERRPHDER
jgi:adenine specific DNA methylase Mod